MADECAHIELRWDECAPVLELIGEFDLANRDQLEGQLRILQQAGCGRVVLDLSKTRFIDSTTLAVLARAHAGGLEISIRDATGIARTALEISGLAAVFSAA
jgi:anti-anti-sigma factor